MYELIQAGEKTYYINCPAKIGIYKVNDNEVYLIDSGNDKDAGRKLLGILKQNNWTLKGIINTHSNADHIGGNQFLQERTGCGIISTQLENAFIKYPILETSFLYGGFPCRDLRNKFLLAKTSDPAYISPDSLPDGIEQISLKGHFFDMIGLKTSDDVYFLADSVFGENIINKYHISFIYDVEGFMKTLDKLDELEGKLFIPSHADVTDNISHLTKINRDKVNEIINVLLDICTKKTEFDDILKEIFDHYSLTMDFNQYVLVGSTIKSYLSYLYDQNRIKCVFEGNRIYWVTNNG